MQLSYRANLTAAEFPLLSEFQGRNVIIMGNDQNFSRQANSLKNKDRDVGIPQMYYAHNVIPTDAGLGSVGYQQLVTAPADTDFSFTQIFYIRDVDGNVAYFSPTSSGRCYVLPSLGLGWLRTTDVSPAAGMEVSIAYVNGETYIFFGGTGCYKYNFSTNTLDAVTLTGLSIPAILGITASNGYMIAWTKDKVLWCSTLSPTDFLPSLVTGAGGGNIQALKGDILTCKAQNGGYVIYTTKNAIAGVYTGNAQAPFTYRENTSCGGLGDTSLVASDGNSSEHYAYTNYGLQLVSLAQSQIVFPQVTDFLAGSQFEDFNDDTLEFTTVQLSGTMKKKLAAISSRYLLMSYGVSSLTHALMYDTALARFGKFRLAHVDCFEYVYPSTEIVETPRRSIGFLQADGTVQVAVLSYDTTGSNGTIILGKYQLDRNRYVTMQEIHLESIRAASVLKVNLLSTIDGKTTRIEPTSLSITADTYRRYNCRAFGLNHSIVITGGFNLHSAVYKMSDSGAVR